MHYLTFVVMDAWSSASGFVLNGTSLVALWTWFFGKIQTRWQAKSWWTEYVRMISNMMQRWKTKPEWKRERWKNGKAIYILCLTTFLVMLETSPAWVKNSIMMFRLGKARQGKFELGFCFRNGVTGFSSFIRRIDGNHFKTKIYFSQIKMCKLCFFFPE